MSIEQLLDYIRTQNIEEADRFLERLFDIYVMSKKLFAWIIFKFP